jgi:drug/metabolite transporter (DMT)-like permease
LAYGSGLLLLMLIATGTPLVPPPDATYLGALVYLSVFGSIIGFTTYLMLVARIGSGRAAYTTVMFPVIALVLSALYEGYHWYWGTFAGVGLTILGNVILFGGFDLVRRPRPVVARP